MSYFEAKIELLNESPQISLRMIAVEAVIMVAIASILVRLFT